MKESRTGKEIDARRTYSIDRYVRYHWRRRSWRYCYRLILWLHCCHFVLSVESDYLDERSKRWSVGVDRLRKCKTSKVNWSERGKHAEAEGRRDREKKRRKWEKEISMMVSALSNNMDNKVEQVRWRNTSVYVRMDVDGWVHQYTRIPPLAEAETVGLVTGECPSIPELAGRLPLLADGVPVVAPAKTAASKNSSSQIRREALQLRDTLSVMSRVFAPSKTDRSFIAASMKRRISRTRTFNSRDEHTFPTRKDKKFKQEEKSTSWHEKQKRKSNRSDGGRAGWGREKDG